MPIVDFDRLPDAARLWIFPASRTLRPDEAERVGEVVTAFLRDWRAHGAPLTAAWRLHRDRFLFVGADETPATASGCSIDALVGSLRDLESEMGLGWMDRAPVFLEIGGRIEAVARSEIAEWIHAGRVDAETTMFDLSVARLGELRNGRFAQPVRDSWLAASLERTRPPPPS